MQNTKNFYDTFYGHKVSAEALEHGYVDYATLAQCFPHIICNNILEAFPDGLELVSGSEEEYFNADGDEIENDEYEALEAKGEEVSSSFKEIYQFFIVSDDALSLLEEAGEIVYYCETLDVYVWAVTHFGTPWEGVLTKIPLKEKED